MENTFNNVNVIVGGDDERSVTIVRARKPTHNTSRVIHSPEIVVRYFSEEEVARFRGIQLTSPNIENNGIIASIWEKCTSLVASKDKRK